MRIILEKYRDNVILNTDYIGGNIMTKDKSFYSQLIRLAIPIMLQNLVTFAVGFADNLMIGTLGDYAVSGVYMGSQFQTILQMFTFGIDSALLIIGAQYWGIKDKESVKKIGAMAIRYALYVGLALTIIVLIAPEFWVGCFTEDPLVIEQGVEYVRYVALSYIFFCLSQMMISTMRCVENAKIGLWVSIIALFTNIFLNWIFIFGKLGLPAMGVKGAAIATLIARIVEAACAFVFAFFIDKKLEIRPKDLLTKASDLRKDFIKCALPVVGGQLVWSVNMLAYTWIMGHLSAGAVTASSMVGQLEAFLRVGVFGLSAALGIVTSMTVGAGKFEKMKEYSKTSEIIFLIVGLLSSGLIWLLKEPFLSLYDVSDEAISISRQFFYVLMVSYVGTSWQATLLGGLVKSGGDTSFVFKNDTIFVFLVVIPLGLLALYLKMPAWVVFAALKSDQVLKCFVAIVKINSFNWMKKLTRTEEA